MLSSTVQEESLSCWYLIFHRQNKIFILSRVEHEKQVFITPGQVHVPAEFDSMAKYDISVLYYHSHSISGAKILK